jgi:hypothetical protein
MLNCLDAIIQYKNIMMLFNYLTDNSLIFYSLFTGTVGFIGYSFASSYLSLFYVDKGIQTDTWEDYSERLSQIGPESLTSIETVTPRFSPVEFINTGSQSELSTIEIGTQTITDGVSTVTTVLPIPPINIEMIPNPDITNYLVSEGVQTMNIPESIISITEIDLIDLLESPIKPLDPMMADEWAVDWEWDAEDLIKIASFFAQ